MKTGKVINKLKNTSGNEVDVSDIITAQYSEKTQLVRLRLLCDLNLTINWNQVTHIM